MSIVKILVLILLILSVIRLGFWGWSFITKRKYKVPLIARIIRAETEASSYIKQYAGDKKNIAPPYISYFYRDKTYINNHSNVREKLKGEQKKQDKTDYIQIYIDMNSPENFSYFPPPDFAVSLLYNVSWALVVAILYVII